jgi:hypothetical protein
VVGVRCRDELTRRVNSECSRSRRRRRPMQHNRVHIGSERDCNARYSFRNRFFGVQATVECPCCPPRDWQGLPSPSASTRCMVPPIQGRQFVPTVLQRRCTPPRPGGDTQPDDGATAVAISVANLQISWSGKDPEAGRCDRYRSSFDKLASVLLYCEVESPRRERMLQTLRVRATVMPEAA